MKNNVGRSTAVAVCLFSLSGYAQDSGRGAEAPINITTAAASRIISIRIEIPLSMVNYNTVTMRS